MESLIKVLYSFIKEIFQFRFISDLPKYYFKPRSFFALIDNEEDKQTFKRLIFYILLYWLIIYILQLSLIKWSGEYSHLRLFSIIIFDFFHFAVLVFPLFILLKISKPKVSLKTFIAFLLLLRLNFVLFFVFFHSLFIIQENYLFAVLKGVIIYGYVFFLIFAFPFIFSFTLGNRLKLIIVSSIIVFAMTFLYGELVFALKPNWKYDVYSVLGDPIGEEVDTINKSFGLLFPNNKFPEIIPLDSLLKSTFFDSTILVKYNLVTTKDYYGLAHDSLKNLLGVVQFNTTKEFILLKLSFTEKLENYYDDLSTLIIKLRKLEQEGIDLLNLRHDLDRSYELVDSLYPQISYVFDLKPSKNGILNVNPKDTQLFRWLSKTAENSNILARAFISIQEDYIGDT